MKIDLTSQKVLVTGCSKGIGLAITRQLLECGARVIGVSRNYPKEINSSSFEHFRVDLFEIENLNEGCLKIIEAHPDISSVILNAGIFEPHDINLAYKEWRSVWEKTMRINCDSVGIFSYAFLKAFKKKGGGRFIFVGSRASYRGETEEYLAYAASKGAITSLSKTIARSYGKYNIKSFVLSPGFVETQMSQNFEKDNASFSVMEELALNEMTLPTHLSPLAAFICTGLMDHATGTTIDINAGSYMR